MSGIVCCQTFGMTPPVCICLLSGEHDLHVCIDCGSAWQVNQQPITRWPGPGHAKERQERLRLLYSAPPTKEQ